MRDYTELVKALRTCKLSIPCTECPFYSNGDEPSKECATMNVAAADAIEELLAKVLNWISVEERLPEPFVPVLVHIPGDRPFPTVREAFIEKTGLWYSTGFRYEQEEVTHWCEMPEPPKEDAE